VLTYAVIVASLHFGVFLVLVFIISLFQTNLFYFFEGTLFGFINLGTLVMMFMPPFAYAVTITELITNTVVTSSDTSTCFGDAYDVEGFTLDMFFGDPIPGMPFNSDCNLNVMTPALLVVWLLFVSAVVYLFTYWLDKVRSDEHKANLSPIFCCLPSYYTSGFSDRVDTGAALTIEHLTKTYKKGVFASEGVTAIRPFQMNVPSDSIFCLLGPNGAGKVHMPLCLFCCLCCCCCYYCYCYCCCWEADFIGRRRSLGVSPALWNRLKVTLVCSATASETAWMLFAP
jgi:hypothetical protein